MKTLMPRNDRVITLDEAETELHATIDTIKHVMGATVVGLDPEAARLWKRSGDKFADAYATALGMWYWPVLDAAESGRSE